MRSVVVRARFRDLSSTGQSRVESPNLPSQFFIVSQELRNLVTFLHIQRFAARACCQKLGAALKGVAVDQGVSGGMPGTPMTFVCITNLTFESREAFLMAFGPHAAEIVADGPNFSNVQPSVQISEIRLG